MVFVFWTCSGRDPTADVTASATIDAKYKY